MNDLLIPKDRLSILKYCRYYYNTDPYIYSNINMYASSINCYIDDKLYSGEKKTMIQNIILECLKTGEVFPIIYGKGRYIMLSPENIQINKTVHGIEEEICLIPDNDMKKLLNSKKDRIKKLVKKMDKNVKRMIRNKEMIPLTQYNVGHIFVKETPLDIRGVSVICGSLRDILTTQQLGEEFVKNGDKSKLKEIKKINNKVIKDIKNKIKYNMKIILPQIETYIEKNTGDKIKIKMMKEKKK